LDKTMTTTTTTTSAISALGAGSGMDVKALATNLVDAERAPRTAIKSALDGIKSALMDIKDQSDFASITPRNSQEASVSVSASASASAGTHTVTVTSLATAQRRLSQGFDKSSTPLNSGGGFSLSLSVHGGDPQTIQIADGKDTPGGIVAAINGANLGVKAQLVNTGEANAPYKIMVTGKTGSLNDFTLSASIDPVFAASGGSSGNLFETSLQDATNAVVNVDGMSLTPSTNQLTDLIPGVTLDLYAPTTGAASVDLIRDTSDVKTRVAALVKSFNDANTVLNTVSDPKSTVATYGGSLAGNSVVESVRSQMREMLFKDSTTPSGLRKNLRDLGVSLDKDGVMTLDNAQLDSALSTSFDDTVTMLTGNTENLSAYSQEPGGAIGSAFRSISSLLSSTGTITTQSDNLTKRIAQYKDELTKLEDRMSKLLERYNQQFGAMESIVGQTKSLQASLTSTFAGMMASYTKGFPDHRTSFVATRDRRIGFQHDQHAFFEKDGRRWLPKYQVSLLVAQVRHIVARQLLRPRHPQVRHKGLRPSDGRMCRCPISPQLRCPRGQSCSSTRPRARRTCKKL
jgi:flagellar hook-associated protein 2